jgi:hypothetical protein
MPKSRTYEQEFRALMKCLIVKSETDAIQEAIDEAVAEAIPKEQCQHERNTNEY